MYTKNLEQCLTQNRCSINGYYFNLNTLHIRQIFLKFLSISRWKKSTWVGEDQREERENPKKSLCCQRESVVELNLTNHIMTWADINSWTLEWLSHLDVPDRKHFKATFWKVRVFIKFWRFRHNSVFNRKAAST